MLVSDLRSQLKKSNVSVKDLLFGAVTQTTLQVLCKIETADVKTCISCNKIMGEMQHASSLLKEFSHYLVVAVNKIVMMSRLPLIP